MGITPDMQSELPRVYWINSLTARNLWDSGSRNCPTNANRMASGSRHGFLLDIDTLKRAGMYGPTK